MEHHRTFIGSSGHDALSNDVFILEIGHETFCNKVYIGEVKIARPAVVDLRLKLDYKSNFVYCSLGQNEIFQ